MKAAAVHEMANLSNLRQRSLLQKRIIAQLYDETMERCKLVFRAS